MTFREWIKGFLRHSALAMAAFVLFAVGLERLIPGFVEPFLNLPMLLLAALLVTICALSVREREPSLGSRLVMAFVAGVACVPAGFFLWTRIGELGNAGLLLFGASVLALGLFLTTLVSSEEA